MVLTAQLIKQNNTYYHGIGSTTYNPSKVDIEFAQKTIIGQIDYLKNIGMTEKARLIEEANFPN